MRIGISLVGIAFLALAYWLGTKNFVGRIAGATS